MRHTFFDGLYVVLVFLMMKIFTVTMLVTLDKKNVDVYSPYKTVKRTLITSCYEKLIDSSTSYVTLH